MIDETIKIYPQVWTVSRLTGYIKSILTEASALRNVMVRGEISDFKKAYSGHCYFKLKDQGAVLTCVMFRSRAAGMEFEAKDGLNVVVRGSINVYEKGGNYQLIVDKLTPEGLGELFLKYLQLKEKLQAKGYFDPARKKPLPFIPRGIGVATSIRGAALHDIITTITKRYPPAGIFISPTMVQGEGAPDSIVNSLKILDESDRVDVIILGRGGGSFEDLNCFNHELVAEAIYKCGKPIISAVGHETDFTISDMIADYRAATPTAAGQAVVPVFADLIASVEDLKEALKSALEDRIDEYDSLLRSLRPEKMIFYLENMVNERDQYLDRLQSDLTRAMNQKLEKNEQALKRAGESLNALNPYRVLERGYAMVQDEKSGGIISRTDGTRPGQDVKIIFCDGEVSAGIKGEDG